MPILGNIPIIGRLFKSQRRSRVKRNLLVFLRPTIIRNTNTLREVTKRKYSHIREIEIDVSGGGLFRLVGARAGIELPEELSDVYSRSSVQPKEPK